MKWMNITTASLVSLMVLTLSGCGGEQQSIELTPVTPSAEQEAATNGSLVFDPISSNIPFPNDILFADTADGTLNISLSDDASASDPSRALNALDGFSTTAPLTVALSKRFSSDQLASAVKLYEVTTNASKVVTGLSATLTYGVDYVASLTSDAKTLVVLPLKPLAPKTSYLVVVTNALTDINGKNAVVGTTYGFLKQTTPLVDGEGNSITPGLPTSLASSLESIRQLTQYQLLVAVGAGLTRDDIVMSWSFSTQSVGDVLTQVTSGISNTSLAVQDSGVDTDAFGGLGAAHVYAGSLTVPYYLSTVPTGTTASPNAALSASWRGAGDTHLTQFNPTPVKTEDVTIPVLMTVPKSGSNWPVVIFQHGITQNRSNLLAVADALANAGYVGVAIDMPLHGITPTDTAAGLRNALLTERTFDMDLNKDGTVDESGSYFINLQSLLTSRDNLRQAVSDLAQLKAALGSITGLDVDESDVSFVGHSLGGMVGAVFARYATDLKASVFAMSGVQAAYLLDGSATFGPEIEAGLAAQGVTKGSADYSQFLRAAQTVMDAGDPVNHVAQVSVPTLLFEVVGDGNTGTDDQVIPNTVTTAPMAGTEPWVSLQGLNSVSASGAVTANKGVVRFTAGDHKSLLSTSASASATATTVMQGAMASFVATQGASVSLSDTSVVKQP